jgi:myo-inositol-1(or 4)-monophosphatase
MSGAGSPVPGRWAAELEVALEAAREGAAILASGKGADEVREKGRADLVTSADEASERAIATRIARAFPADAFIAEEFSATLTATGRRWIADPLDGTVNFVHGHPFVCVSLALVDEEGPAVAVVHAPFLREVYHATRGGGAFLNGSRISVSPVTRGDASLLATGFPFKAGKGDPDAYFRLLAEMVRTTHGVRRAGAAALDLAYVAAGRVDGFFETGLSSWDIAAGILLVNEAGGAVSAWPGDELPPLATGRVLASNGSIHHWLEKAVGAYASRI